MMRGAWSLVFLVVFVPFFSFAATCPAGYTTHSLDEAKAIILRSDECSDEEIRVVMSGIASASVCHKITTKRECKADSPYGCKQGQTRPKLVAIMPQNMGGKTLTINKCDKKGLSNAIDASFDAGSPNPLLQYAADQERTQSLTSGQPLSSGDVIQRALSGTGASQETIRAATQNPDLLAALRGGDSVEIETAAKRAGLTAEQTSKLVSEQGRLTAAAIQRGPTAAENLARLAGVQTVGNGQTGWGNTGQSSQGASSPFDCSTGSGSGSGSGSNLGGLASSIAPLLNQLAGQSPFSMAPQKKDETPTQESGGNDGVALLIVQRTTVHPGESLLISWSSIGMRSDTPCRLYIGANPPGVQFAEGYEGSKSVRIADNETGQIKIMLRCTSPSKQTVEKTVTINVI